MLMGIDGALGSWGAAMLEPYSDKSDTSGVMLINETSLTNVVKEVSASPILDFVTILTVHLVA
jgi:predicted amidohydrolase YtcJ